MCGIFGIVALSGREPSLDDAHCARLRDMLAHRGPDGTGLWRRRNAVLAHRRLAVVDLSPEAAQPMVSADGRFALVYNGELYNDAEVRREIEQRGASAGGGFRGFRTRCDAETVLYALATWSSDALARLRGMYAIALYDAKLETLTLARDPLGVKPLYFHAGAHELVFASEPGPILAHPLVEARPNLEMVSAYLTTIRSVLGNDTLFDAVHALRPAEMAQCHFGGSEITIRLLEHWRSVRPRDGAEITEEGAAHAARAALDDSVRRQLRADVPTCALLSGGLDSAIVTSVASRALPSLRTYCAGAATDEPSSDFPFARLAAGHFRTEHAEAVVTRELFAERWEWMIGRLGQPLSTPNEVAIYEVASRLRADGCVVTLSGEGADELFGGYEAPLAEAWRFERARDAGASPARFQLESNAWIPTSTKGAILNDQIWDAIGQDAWLIAWAEREFERSAAQCGAPSGRLPAEFAGVDPVEAHLRHQRRVNLTGLLQRLDTATMLAGVEGRTPFADSEVALLAESLPLARKFTVLEAPEALQAGGGAATILRTRSKIALRDAFRADLPGPIADRPKASFPLPFQAWIADRAQSLHTSDFARTVFSAAAIETISHDPARHWRLAWPMLNIAMWGKKWWG